MLTKNYTLADIFNASWEKYLTNHKASLHQHKVIRNIRRCKTPSMGYHIERCDNKECGHIEIKPNSCGDRHCNKCNSYKRYKWIAKQMKDLLPVTYYHVIFTMPHVLNNLSLCNKEEIYEIFFKSSFYTLNKFSSDKKYLGGKLGYIGVLHSWGQKLSYHPHIHYIVTGGGIRGKDYVSLPYKKEFLFPVMAMSKVMRGKFVELLKETYSEDRLKFPGKLAVYSSLDGFNILCSEAFRAEWVIFSKPPILSSEKVLEYISRYTYRVAISNTRIKAVDEATVIFSYKDYKDTDKKGIAKIKEETISCEQFIQRFLWHILPEGFRKIRYGGIFSPGIKAASIEIIRKQLLEKIDKLLTKIDIWYNSFREYIEYCCPNCLVGHLSFEYGPQDSS
jgi:hypothetical protein